MRCHIALELACVYAPDFVNVSPSLELAFSARRNANSNGGDASRVGIEKGGQTLLNKNCIFSRRVPRRDREGGIQTLLNNNCIFSRRETRRPH